MSFTTLSVPEPLEERMPSPLGFSQPFPSAFLGIIPVEFLLSFPSCFSQAPLSTLLLDLFFGVTTREVIPSFFYDGVFCLSSSSDAN